MGVMTRIRRTRAVVGGERGLGRVHHFQGLALQVGKKTRGLVADEFRVATYEQREGRLVVDLAKTVSGSDNPLFTADLHADSRN